MKTILYGNGLNLITNPDLSWDALLPKIDNNWQVSQTLQCIAPPNTIQYDQFRALLLYGLKTAD